ncbi:hypothetical protein BC937DRAFT_93766 [Endogone sp. FLAS-F59071]|nr:hypothetical protein BC937DRAFT_93766 [Endogone sp. FLAS-F59071]|eukprot:RUS14477.1 hypothetical protein BC937DRAFT_93766 [Endogone sp. FLAS-F59071]
MFAPRQQLSLSPKRDPVATLSSEEASDAMEYILSDLSLQRYLPSFRQHRIDLYIFLAMTPDDLARVGVNADADRQRLFECAWGIRTILRNGPSGTVPPPSQSTKDDNDDDVKHNVESPPKSKDAMGVLLAPTTFAPSSNKSSSYAHSLMSIAEDDESVFELNDGSEVVSRLSISSSPSNCSSSRNSGVAAREAIRFYMSSIASIPTLTSAVERNDNEDHDIQFHRKSALERLNGAGSAEKDVVGDMSDPTVKPKLKVKLVNADIRRHTAPAAPRRDYIEDVAKARASWQGRIEARPEEGREVLPPYECTVDLAGYLFVKREFDRPGEKAKDRSWKKLWLHIYGTQLRIYRFEPRNLDRDKPWATMTMQRADAGVAADYTKRKYVIRLRTLGPQLLIRANDHDHLISWVEQLQSSANISLSLDERSMPRFITLPRRQRRGTVLTERQREAMRESERRNMQETLV